MASAEELRAALAVAELEEELVAAKGTKDGPSQELKDSLREARWAFRSLREGRPVEPGETRPDTVQVKAKGN